MVTMSKYIKRNVKSLSLLKYNWVIKVKMHLRKHTIKNFKYENKCIKIYIKDIKTK